CQVDLVAMRHLEAEVILHPRGPARAGRSPSARWLILCAAAAVTALTAAAAAQSAPSDTLISAPKTYALAAGPSGYWGGVYRAATGENVTVYASNAYPVEPALGQRW